MRQLVISKGEMRDATFLWKRYVFEGVDIFGSWVTHRGPCVHGELPRTWRGEGALQMDRRHVDFGEGALQMGRRHAGVEDTTCRGASLAGL